MTDGQWGQKERNNIKFKQTLKKEAQVLAQFSICAVRKRSKDQAKRGQQIKRYNERMLVPYASTTSSEGGGQQP